MKRHDTKTAAVLSMWDIGIVLAVYLTAMMIVGGVPHPRLGFPLDDSWIHQVVARNLAHDGTLGFIPGVRSSGSSSLLWTFALAANWKFLPMLNPVLYSAAVSVVLFFVTGASLLAMARKDGMATSACWILALTPALDGNFIWLGMIGMEHLLFVALSVAGAYLWFQRSLRSAVAAALCMGALSLTRPEGLVLAALAILTPRWAKRRGRDLAVLAGTVLLCVLISLLANFITSRSWLPTTYAGRKWLYFGSDHIPLTTRLSFPYALFRSLLQPWAIYQTHPLYIVNGLIALLMTLGIWRIVSAGRKRISFLLFWSFLHIAIYTVMLPTRSHGGRYQPLFLAFSFPLMFLGLQQVLKWGGQRSQSPGTQLRTSRGLIVAICLTCGLLSLWKWRIVTGAGIALIEMTHAKMGRFLIEDLPPNSKVAALDIGRMGYLYGGQLGDMGGLTDSSLLPYMRSGRAFTYLQDRNFQYLVWPTDAQGIPDVRQILTFSSENSSMLTQMERFCAPHDLWFASYSVTLDAAPCQTLFRVKATP